MRCKAAGARRRWRLRSRSSSSSDGARRRRDLKSNPWRWPQQILYACPYPPAPPAIHEIERHELSPSTNRAHAGRARALRCVSVKARGGGEIGEAQKCGARRRRESSISDGTFIGGHPIWESLAEVSDG
jgi:hypothetical protein